MNNRIKDFEARIQMEREYCEELYRWATVRLLAFKYAYYVLAEEIIKDIAYDGEETSWYVMGRALGHLKEDETSPCIDYDPKHPLASEAEALAKKYLKIK
jgi:hypothetical protein